MTANVSCCWTASLYLKHFHCTHVTCVPLISTATKADGFALYFLGECNNVSAEDICWIHFIHWCSCVYAWRGFFLPPFLFPSPFHFLCFSIEFMFVHSYGGQGWPSKPHPLRPHRIWDNHCRSCCQDSQNTASRGHHGGKALVSQPVQIYPSLESNSLTLHCCDVW